MTANPPASSASTGFKYSDYADVVTITSSAIASGSAFGFISTTHPEVTGIFAGIAVLSALVSRWLSSHGD